VVLMEVSLSFLYHKFATASHTAILLRNPSPVCVYVCMSTHMHVGGCGCVQACVCHLECTLVLDTFCWIVLGLSGVKGFSDKHNK